MYYSTVKMRLTTKPVLTYMDNEWQGLWHVVAIVSFPPPQWLNDTNALVLLSQQRRTLFLKKK